MKSKIIENVGYISIALVLALTLVLSFSAVDFNNGLIAHAQQEPSDNTIFVYPGSTSIVPSNFDAFAGELYYFNGSDVSYTPITTALSVDLSFLENNSGALLQFLFYVDASLDSDYFLYLTDIVMPFSYFGVAGDFGWGDQYFVYDFEFYDDFDTGELCVKVDFHQFLDDYDTGDVEAIYLYDIRLVEPQINNNNSTAEGFLSIVGDGISFGFESIADGITYTVENLYFNEEGSLSDFSIIIFCLTGVSLALAVCKYILRIIFSFGGVKL